jgi:hypothetical protein
MLGPEAMMSRADLKNPSQYEVSLDPVDVCNFHTRIPVDALEAVGHDASVTAVAVGIDVGVGGFDNYECVDHVENYSDFDGAVKNFGDPNVSPSRALAVYSAMSDPNVSLNHHGTRTYPVEEQT